MNTSISADDPQSRLKVSVITRLIGALTYTVPAIGAALGSLLLINMFRALRANQSAGLAAVMQGMKEASLPVTVSLYLAALCGVGLIIVLVIRMFVQTKTASPPFWFFVLGGILSFLPAVLFWKAQLLILEVLSPGSSVASNGLAGVVADINRLLLIGIVALPVVFIVLVVLSVLPFSSRPGPKWFSLIAAVGIEVLLVAAAVAVPFFIDGPQRKNEIVELPLNVKYADSEFDIYKDTSMVVTLGPDNKLYQRETRDLPNKVETTDTFISMDELPTRVQRVLEDKTPDRRVVYFKSDINADYQSVLQVFDSIRKADVDRVGLVVIGEKTVDDPYQVEPLSFMVHLPEPIDKTRLIKPNPLTLVATLASDGKLLLNNEVTGTVSDPERLRGKLEEIFKERENNGVFRERTNEIEKTVFLKVSGPAKYGDFIKLVEAVKGAGAQPIGIQIDDTYNNL